MEKEIKYSILKKVNDDGLSSLPPFGAGNYKKLIERGYLESKSNENVVITELGKEFLRDY